MTPKQNIRGWSLARFLQQAGPPASERFRNHNDFRQVNLDVTSTEVERVSTFVTFFLSILFILMFVSLCPCVKCILTIKMCKLYCL